jgi:hypothetical protein
LTAQPLRFSMGFAVAATVRVRTARTFLASIFTVVGLEARAEACLLLAWN